MDGWAAVSAEDDSLATSCAFGDTVNLPRQRTHVQNVLGNLS